MMKEGHQWKLILVKLIVYLMRAAETHLYSFYDCSSFYYRLVFECRRSSSRPRR